MVEVEAVEAVDVKEVKEVVEKEEGVKEEESDTVLLVANETRRRGKVANGSRVAGGRGRRGG